MMNFWGVDHNVSGVWPLSAVKEMIYILICGWLHGVCYGLDIVVPAPIHMLKL